MDPVPVGWASVPPRFPRPRGDGPYQAQFVPSVGGFPRPRGDGPRGWRARPPTPTVSPPTRGWTDMKEAQRQFDMGFPAHAGMDRDSAPRGSGAAGFPRPRGDGPRSTRARFRLSMVSPPTRGWTSRICPNWRVPGGFPAHAGMDPVMLTGVVGGRWFPRPRGDGPLAFWIRLVWMEVSPPTRGWTSMTLARSESLEGFPAHAGMDPRPAGACSDGAGFPRPRGDGPYRICWVRCSTTVSPVHAAQKVSHLPVRN